MKIETIEKQIYVTEDGKKFEEKKDAIAHEELLAEKQALDKYRIDGPRFLMYLNDSPLKIDTGYDWYKVESPTELVELLHLLEQTYNRKVYYAPKGSGFPIYLAYSEVRRKIVDFDYLAELHEKHQIQWAEFKKELFGQS